jgi:hypothetical protein
LLDLLAILLGKIDLGKYRETLEWFIDFLDDQNKLTLLGIFKTTYISTETPFKEFLDIIFELDSKESFTLLLKYCTDHFKIDFPRSWFFIENINEEINEEDSEYDGDNSFIMDKKQTSLYKWCEQYLQILEWEYIFEIMAIRTVLTK